MNDTTIVLQDLLSRLVSSANEVCTDLSEETARFQIVPGTNTICWLLWHSGRCIDAQIHDALGGEQLWTQWAPRLHLPLPVGRLGAGAIGYGQDPADVIHVVAPVADLHDYLLACCQELATLIEPLTDDDLARVVDRHWDPPVTLQVRIVSILVDCLEHLGQAAYLRGVVDRMAPRAA
ncbi:mycothiol transferase [Acidipropionibacterium timonense]|uniref:mycothiol transferase n=1 Tax=Acidipropionibacterium timonense TaxID=2161818 RepID=UPI0010317D5B|nr:DUF664 domain-containing protein [Acidipropionibacterium timonense]